MTIALAGCAASRAPTAASPETSSQPGKLEAPGASIASPIGRMAHVNAAGFVMGSNVGEEDERPAHPAQVAAFDIDLTEVTVGQYRQCVTAGQCQAAPTVIQFPGVTSADQLLFDSECNDDRMDRQDHPENCVDWAMANAYCHWAGKRLPTEEEWEYAACAGDCDKAVGGRGGVIAILGAERWPFTTRVATGAPGAFGLYDMAGNVWEWTASEYCPYHHLGCGDSRRVIRGGSWSMVDFLFVRLTDRSPADPFNRNTNVGFRCAQSSH